MGVLKVRSGGAWLDVGMGAGGSLPPGGVAGDILVKLSATLNDATWGTSMPKLTLSAGAAIALDTANPGLLIGAPASTNLALGFGAVQARNNGAASTLYLNALGGDIQLGVGTGTAKVKIGDDAYFQDVNALHALGLISSSDSNWGKLRLGPSVLITGSATYYQLGAPAAGVGYYDANTHYFRSAPGADYVSIGAGPTIGFPGSNKIDVSGTELRMWGGATVTNFANTWGLLNSAGTGWKMRHDANNVFEVWAGAGSNFYGSVYTDSSFYAGTNAWFRVRGVGVGVHWENYAGGWYMNDATSMKVYGSKIIYSNVWAGNSYYQQPFFNDAGASMAGYGWHPGGVAGCLRMQTNNPRYHMNNVNSDGYYDVLAVNFVLSSTEHGKQEIVPVVRSLPATLNPVATMVRSLRPVWYRTREPLTMTEVPPKPDDMDPDESYRPLPEDMPIHVCRTEGTNNCGHTPDDPCSWRVNWLRGHLGFVAEEVERVLPALVTLDPDMNPDGVALGSLVGLAYAMLQELDTRLTALEAA